MPALQESIRVTQNDLASAEKQGKGLRLTWADGSDAYFHNTWLRHCCFCEICGDCYSSKRFLIPSDIPLGISPSSVAVTHDGDLSIIWANDGHQSVYQADWLQAHRYDDESRKQRRHQPTLWRSDIEDRLPIVGYNDVKQSDETRMDLYRSLRDNGFCVVKNGLSEPGSITKVADFVGGMGVGAYGEIFDLSPSSAIRTMGNTTRTVPPHTDEPFQLMPPGILILSCIQAANDGGDTVLVDGFNLAETMRAENPELFDLLATTDHYFVRRHPGKLDQRVHAPVFALDDTGNLAGVRIHTRSSGPLDVASDKMQAYFEAYHHLSRLMMDPVHQLRLKLQPGESVLLDNHRVLHSRTHFTDTNRFLQLCNVPRGRFQEQLRLLADKLGHGEEARMILSAGAIV